MHKIVVATYEPDTTSDSKATHETTNQQKLQNWFNAPANWEKLAEQLTKKLGDDKFKNVTLTKPIVTYE
ncbi:hemagglutinin, partial [Mycoplasmopsis synoviae]